MQNDIMTVKDVATYLKLNEKTADKRVVEGKLPGFKVGGSWRFRRSAIEAWIDSQMERNKSSGDEECRSGVTDRSGWG